MVIELFVMLFCCTHDFKIKRVCNESNHAYDLRPNCTLLSSITIISEPYPYWYIPNYTQNYVITYTNCTLLSSITIILDAKIIRGVEGWIKVLGDIFWAELVSEICWFFCLRITLLPADGIPELKHKSVLFMCESPCWEPTKDHE